MENSSVIDLTYFCDIKHINKAKTLIENSNINPDFQDGEGYTFLILATMNNNIELVKFLLEYQKEGFYIDPNIKDNNHDNALILASYWGNVEIVKLLLDYKRGNFFTDPNICDYYGYTALIWATRKNNIDIVKLLLEHSRKECIGVKYALTWARCNNYKEIISILENYIYFRKNIKEFIPSYNILLYILIKDRCTSKYNFTSNIPNEIILLIKEYGEQICRKLKY